MDRLKGKPEALRVALVFFCIALLLAVAGVCHATTEDHRQYGSLHVLDIVWATDTGAATVTNYTSVVEITGAIVAFETAAGATPPTDQYDITVTNDLSRSIMGTTLNDRSDTDTEYVRATNGIIYNRGHLTFAIANNSVNDAGGTIRVFWYGDERRR